MILPLQSRNTVASTNMIFLLGEYAVETLVKKGNCIEVIGALRHTIDHHNCL